MPSQFLERDDLEQQISNSKKLVLAASTTGVVVWGLIPRRIESIKGLRLGPSNTVSRASNGVGVFVESNVMAGELIFKIIKPSMVVGNDIDPVQRIWCDNCFATIDIKDDILHRTTIPLDNLSAECAVLCSGCLLVNYCSKECSNIAQEHHHHVECQAYNGLREYGKKNDDDKSDMERAPQIRYMLRLISLYESSASFQEIWKEFEGLQQPTRAEHMIWKGWEDSAVNLLKLVNQLLVLGLKTDLKQKEIIQHLFKMAFNKIQVVVPYLRGTHSWYYPILSPCVSPATFVDPFVSKITHSCNPNSWCVFDGKDLNVRATRDIAAGEELTINYTSREEENFERRQNNLKAYWNIDCNCSLCNKGALGPDGELREKVLYLIKLGPSAGGTYRIEERMQRAIGDMNAYGFSGGSTLMVQLYRVAIHIDVHNKVPEKALKKTLLLYFQVEPHATPAISLPRRINTLFNIIAYTMPLRKRIILPEIPHPIRYTLYKLQYPLREILAKATAKCYGVASIAATYERDTLAAIIKTTDDFAVENGRFEDKYISPQENDEAKKAFMENMNEVLKWASIPEHNYEQLMP